MASERWHCPSCGATCNPAPEPPPGCAQCDAPLHVGKFGLLAEIEPDRSARVFRGRESSGSTNVIVRMFPENLKVDASLIRQAVKRASALSHPAIAPPLDAGTWRNQTYFVETAVPGVPITNADLPLREAVSMMRIVADALDYAHSKGVCHPDLRAGDIRVLRAGRTPATTTGWKVSVTSFGIANGGSVRDNVGAFGRILYAMATGRSPRDWATLAPSSVNPLVDSELEAIILMAMDPSGQPPSMDVIAAELGRWLDGGVKAGTAPKTVVPPPKFRHPWKVYGKLGAAAAVLVVLLVLVFRGGDRPIEPVPVAAIPKPTTVEAPAPDPKPAEVSPPVAAPPPAPVEPPAPKPDPAPPSVEPRPKPPEEKPEPVKPPPPPPEPPKPAPPPAPVKPPEEKPEPVKPAPPPPEPPKPAPPPAPVKPPEEKPAPPPPPPPAPPKPEPAPVPPPPPPERAPAAGGVGDIFRIHLLEGVFVKLSGASTPAKGETLEAVRKGKVVAKLRVRELTPSERRYPKGCAVCEVTSGTPAEGDFVRKGSP